MKHEWREKKVKFHRVKECIHCDQEWPYSEAELFPRIDALSCPHLNRQGKFVIEVRPFGWNGRDDDWVSIDRASTIREAFDWCYFKFEGREIRLCENLKIIYQ